MRRPLLDATSSDSPGVAAAGLAFPGQSFAQKSPPKPANIVSPDDALKLLMSGNRRYVQGVTKRRDFKNEREALSKGQNPYAGILSCADSRVAPEYAFDSAPWRFVRVPRRRQFPE